MPKNIRQLPTIGLGPTKEQPDKLGGRLFDCDRATATKGGSLRAWPGGRRMGRKLRDSRATFQDNNPLGTGTLPDQYGYDRPCLQVLRFPQHYLGKSNGHGLAVVDTAEGTDGRILSLAHHSGGMTGDQIIGKPYYSGGSSDDMEVRGVYSGATPKVFLVAITDTGDPNLFAVVRTGDTTFGDEQPVSAAWTDIGDGVQVRWRGGSTNHGGQWMFVCGERPSIGAFLHRIGPNVYPAITGGVGKSFISTSFDLVQIDDGQTIQPAGLPQPQIQPTVIATITATPTDLGQTDDDPVAWVAGGDATGVIVSRGTTDPDPADGPSYVAIKVPKSLRHGKVDLAYVDLDVPLTIKPTVKRIRFYLYVKVKEGRIEKNELALVLADTAGLTGTRKVIKLPNKSLKGHWIHIDLPYTGTEEFVVASIGLRLEGSLDSSLFFSTDFIRFFFDGFTTDGDGSGDGTAASSELFATGDWYFRFSWRRSLDGRVSAPSPWSEAIKMNGTGVTLDLSGSYPQIVNGLANSPPIGVDMAVIYVATSSAGGDPRLGGAGLSFFRLTAAEGIPISSVPAITIIFSGTGNGTLDGLIVAPGSPTEDWLINCEDDSTPGSEIFSINGSVSGNSNNRPGQNIISTGTGNGTLNDPRCKNGLIGNQTWTLTCTSAPSPGSEVWSVVGTISGAQDPATTNELYDNNICAFQILNSTINFTVGHIFTFDVVPLATVGVPYSNDFVSFTITEGLVNFINGDDFRFTTNNGEALDSLTYTLSDEAQRGLLLTADNPRDPFYNSEPRPGDVAVQDGSLIVTARRPAYGVGRWTWTDDSHVIVPVDSGDMNTNPLVGRWMEGRSIRRAGESTTYRILKAMDQDGDGLLDALYIGSKFDPKQQILEGPYVGTTGDEQGIILSDSRSIDWCNITSAEGEDIEAQSLLNRLEVMPPGDEVQCIFKTDESLWAVGTDNATLLIQNPSALADLPAASGTAYSNPLHSPGIGAAGPRAWVARPDGTAWVLGPKGQLWVFSSNGVQKHPLSEKLSALLAGRGFLLDTEQMKNAYLTSLKPDADADYIWIGMAGSAPTGNPASGILIRSQDEHATITETTFHLNYEAPWREDSYVRTS